MSAATLDCVTHLEYRGRDIYLVGTAHVSQKSVDEVGRVISDVRPDTVCVELDAARHRALVDPTRWRSLDIFEVIRERRITFLLTSLVLSSYQRRLGAKLGVRPGAEMIAAIEQARSIGAHLVLADRDMQATLRRTWAALSPWDCLQLIGTLVGALFAKGEITEEQVEALKDRDTISELIREFAEVMPRLQRPLIDERDRFLMSSVREAPGQRVVAVVGAGHVGGMVNYLHAEVDRKALSEIPRPSWLSRSTRWVFLLIFLAVLGRVVASGGQGELLLVLSGWAVACAVFAGAFALLARAHPLTVLAAALSAPLLVLLPGTGAGIAAAYAEAWLRRPTQSDCEGLSQVSSLADWKRNRFTRVLTVAFVTSVGSGIGAFAGVLWMLLAG
jgi:pheromone shutdown-related protein TraB